MTDSISSVLFDLDGTLLDTAPDLGLALNRVLQQEGRDALAPDIIRPHVSMGASALVTLGFGTNAEQAEHQRRYQQLLDFYGEQVALASRPFDGIEPLLQHIETSGIPWGVVTNKPRRYAEALLTALSLNRRCAVLICPDDVRQRKPDPEALLLACTRIAAMPDKAIYIGDHQRDIEAGRRAGMHTVAALYGYIPESEDPYQWQADFYLSQPIELIDYLEQLS